MRGEKEGKQWQNAEGEMAKRDLDIYRCAATDRSINHGNSLNKCVA
jgi:hypothetical protein